MFERHGLRYIEAGARVLEIGPDASPSAYQQRCPDTAVWDTLDFASNFGYAAQLTYVLHDPYSFPVADSAYDVVVSGQVLEHIPKPWRWIPEIARVIRPGGVVITVAPISWPYHEAPKDCWRVYPDGLSALYEDAGLEVLEAHWGGYDLGAVARRLPGHLRESRNVRLRLSGLVLLVHERLRWPTTGAFDTIGVARKPV